MPRPSIAPSQRTDCKRTLGTNPSLLPKRGVAGRSRIRRWAWLWAAASAPTEGNSHPAGPWSSAVAHSAIPFGRSDKELEQIAECVGKSGLGITNVRGRTFNSKETWTIYPLNEQLFVVARDGALLSTSQLEAIGKICDAPPKQSSKTTRTR